MAVGDQTDEEQRLATRIASLEAVIAERDAKLAERDAKLAEMVELVAKLSGQIESSPSS